MAEVIDVQVDEARAICALQIRLNRKYAGQPKDIAVWGNLKNELVDGMAELGFKVEVYPDPSSVDVWVPCCDIVGRTDARLQQFINESGGDSEKMAWYAQRVPSSELKQEGVDMNLLG